jgi:hypothetical protein
MNGKEEKRHIRKEEFKAQSFRIHYYESRGTPSRGCIPRGHLKSQCEQ